MAGSPALGRFPLQSGLGRAPSLRTGPELSLLQAAHLLLPPPEAWHLCSEHTALTPPSTPLPTGPKSRFWIRHWSQTENSVGI